MPVERNSYRLVWRNEQAAGAGMYCVCVNTNDPRPRPGGYLRTRTHTVDSILLGFRLFIVSGLMLFGKKKEKKMIR